MTNLEYVESLVSVNDMIYIDTSSLMNVEVFEEFVENYRNIFLDYQKRIIVTREVCLEIVKHLSSDSMNKQIKAKNVVRIFKNYSNLFTFEDENLNEFEVGKAFADSELLSRMTKEKSEFRQLLITNDKKLSLDAYSLNSLNSCKGQKIMVCYINGNGKLNKALTESPQNVKDIEVNSIVAKQTCEVKNNENSSSLKNYIIGVSALIVGYGIGKFLKFSE